MKLKYKRVREVKRPSRGTPESAGIDLYLPPAAGPIRIRPHKALLVPSGVVVEFPPGYVLIALNKSSVASKKGLLVGAQVVDQDYQGEIWLHLINVSSKTVEVYPGEKVIQLVLLPFLNAELEEVDEIHTSKTVRGTGNFGSTGG